MRVHPRNQAFTIVELLIVVVVIAVLAAITVVAYNGITEQAKASTTASDLNSVQKALEVRRVDGHSIEITNESQLRAAGLGALAEKATIMTSSEFADTFRQYEITPNVDIPRGRYVIYGSSLRTTLIYWSYGDNTWRQRDFRISNGNMTMSDWEGFLTDRSSDGSDACTASNFRDCFEYPT